MPEAAINGGLHVLVVDDSRANRLMLRALLTLDGHIVTETDNGADAIERVRLNRYDVVLMDIRMPMMDGIEATLRIRTLPGDAARTPVIAVSADETPETWQACLAAGINALIAKPVHRDILLSALRQVQLAHLQRTQTMEPS